MAAAVSVTQAEPLTWQTIVNNADLMPGSTVTFNSFNQPSVNANGLVVFRARSKGGAMERSTVTTSNFGFSAEPTLWSTLAATGPVHGIYLRNMASGGL